MTNIFKRKLFWAPLLVVLVFVLSGRVGATITSTFVANQTVANLSAVDDQSANTNTTVANVSSIANDQSATTTTTQANVVAASASVTIDSDIVITADAVGASGNNISVEIVQSDVDLGASTNATIDVSKTVNAILVNVQHNSNLTPAIIDVTRTSIVDALNMSASGTVQGGLVTVTITNDVTGDITASGGSLTKVGTVGATSLSGGQDAVAQVNTITITGTPEDGDTFTATLPTVGAVNYVALITDTTNDLIASGLNSAIQGSAGYATQDFTSSVAGNVITLTAKVAGTGFTQTSGATDKAVAQINTITITGTPEDGDTFTATLPISGAVNYVVQSGDDNDDIALGLNSAIQSDINYPSQDFTSSVAGNVITLTAKVAGTGFTQTSGATNRTAVAQEVTFTPASVSVGETFRATVNGTDYDFLAGGASSVQNVVEALAPLMDANGAVDCTEDDIKVTCVSSTPGTSFTFGATVVDETAPVISSLSLSPATGTAKIGDAITLTIVSDQVGYSEDIITVNGESVTGFASAGGTNYSATYTVVSGDDDRVAGTVPVSVVLDDGDGNTNTAYTTVNVNTLRIDANRPVFQSAETTSTTTIDLTFSEEIHGSHIAVGDFTVASGAYTVSAASKTASNKITLTVSPAFATSDTPDVSLVGSIPDLALNDALAATITPSDGVAPVLTEVTPIPTPDNDSTPDYTFSSTEAGTISYGGACSSTTTTAVAGPNTITFSTLSDDIYDDCTVTVTDASGNVSVAQDVSDFEIDTVAPTLALSSLVSDPTNDSPILVTATFSEDVTGFSQLFDIVTFNGWISNFTPISGSVYSFYLHPGGQGTVAVGVDENKVMDLAGNNNTPAADFEITYDTVPPVITLSGSNPVNIEYGETYVDAGATASDTHDGDITGSIVQTGSVNTAALGSYTLFYNVSDAAGNTATEVTRTVNVVPRAITVTANTASKVYDGNTTSSVIPSITSGTLAFADVANFTQSYDNKNVGTGKTLTPAGTVTDGNGGANYAVTFVTDTTGEITARTLTVSATGVNKVYDGTDTATVTLSDNRVSGDVLILSYGGATFNNKHVGVGKTVSVSGISVTGTDAGNYTWNTTANTTANVTTRPVTVTAVANTKVYDATTSASATPTVSPALVGGDTSVQTETYDNKNVGTGKTLTPAIVITDGNGGANYAVTLVNSATGVITQAPATVSFTADNKVYDGGTSATILTRTVTGNIAPDAVITATGGTATFANKTVANGKTVTATGFTLSDSNYFVNTINSTTANITPRALTVSATGINKQYDAGTNATVTLSDNRVSGDVLTTSYTDAEFDDRHVGVGKDVDVSGIAITGTDAGNYTVNTSTTTTADITPAPLTITALTNTKFFDGTTSAAAIPVVTGLLGSDTVTDLSEVYVDELVGEAKNMFVDTYTVNDGNGGANYAVTTVLNNSGVIMRVFSSGGGGGSGSRAKINESTGQVLGVSTTPGQVLGESKHNFTQNMRIGASGLEVVELQKLLNTLGFGPLVTDGKFGPMTRAAVIRFQLANGLVGDGIVGPLTRAVLNK